MKNIDKNSNIAQKVFRKTQWEFTFIILGISAGLIATAFFAIYLFTMLSNQVTIGYELKDSLDILSTYMVQQETLEADPDYYYSPSELVKLEDIAECDNSLFVIEGEINEIDYTVNYDITSTYNTSLLVSDTDEYLRIEEAVFLTAKNNLNSLKAVDSTMGRTYISSVVSFTAQQTFSVLEEDIPEDFEGDILTGDDDKKDDDTLVDPNDPSLPDDSYVDIVVSIYNKYIAVYDYTAEQYTLTSLIVVLAITFALVVIAMYFLAYFLSGKVLSPAKNAYIRQKDLIANASHELKTPITIINANLEVMTQNKELTVQENAKWISNIQQQSIRMSDLVVDMLDLFRFESEHYQPENKVVNISRELAGMALSFEATCYEQNIEITTNISRNVVCMIDSKGFSKIINILLDNATKYCNVGGKISVRLYCLGKNLFIEIANTGTAIPPEEVKKIFDRFHKFGDKSQSFGLGLAMARSIVQNMHGDIGCTSTDEITIFTVKLPIKHWRK